MLRYLLLSAAIVVSVAVVVAGWVHRDLIRIKIASVYARAPAKPAAAGDRGSVAPAPLSGDAPWALSALPDCLTQTSESTGSEAYVRAHLPPGAVRVRPPAKLTYGDCRIAIVGDEAFVRRGSDLLHIPAPARFYRAGARLALVRGAGNSVELRVYEPSHD
jgi:hypothetical protein